MRGVSNNRPCRLPRRLFIAAAIDRRANDAKYQPGKSALYYRDCDARAWSGKGEGEGAKKRGRSKSGSALVTPDCLSFVLDGKQLIMCSKVRDSVILGDSSSLQSWSRSILATLNAKSKTSKGKSRNRERNAFGGGSFNDSLNECLRLRCIQPA